MPILPLAMHYCGVYFHSATKPPPPTTKKHASQSKASKTHSKDPSHEETLSSLRAVSDDSGAARADKPSEKIECNGAESRDEKEDEKAIAASSKEGGDAAPVAPSAESPAGKEGEDEEKNPGSVLQQGEGDAPESPRTPLAAGEPPQPSSESEVRAGQRRRARKVRVLVLLLAVSNLLPLLYFSLIHQRGTIDVMKYLHDAVARRGGSSSHRQQGGPRAGDSTDILVLMPCHSTPYYSFLHANVSMRFLTCEPNLSHAANYTDEAAVFYSDPARWLKEEYQNAERAALPTHVVYFNVLQGSVEEFLTLGGYSTCATFFHTHVPEGRTGSHVLVSCR